MNGELATRESLGGLLALTHKAREANAGSGPKFVDYGQDLTVERSPDINLIDQPSKGGSGNSEFFGSLDLAYGRMTGMPAGRAALLPSDRLIGLNLDWTEVGETRVAV